MRRWRLLPVIATLAACSGAAGDGTTSIAPTTNPTVTSITVPATTTTTRAGPGPMPPLIMASDDGINVLTPDGIVHYLARPVSVALSDLRDGFVYQETVTGYPNWQWDEADSRPRLEWIDGPGPPPIMWLPAEGAPAVLIAADEAWLTPLSVRIRDGAPVLFYTVQRPTAGSDCSGWPGGKDECVWQHLETRLIARDLDTGDETDLGFVSGYESGFIYWTFGGGRSAFVYNAYADEGAWSGVIEYPPAGDASLSSIAFDPDEYDLIWGPEYLCQPGQACAAALRGAIAPDGSALALAYRRYEPGAVPRVIIIDLADGSTRLDAPIGGPAMWPTWIDFDGTNVLVGRDGDRGTDAPVLADGDGWVTELDPTTRYAFRGIMP